MPCVSVPCASVAVVVGAYIALPRMPGLYRKEAYCLMANANVAKTANRPIIDVTGSSVGPFQIKIIMLSSRNEMMNIIVALSTNSL